MADIRDVTLEFLRPGPAHNQLLSPLTPYIALCGADGPVSVNVPFEHRQLLSRLERLRYVTPLGAIPRQQREAEVREIGEILGEVLGKVPALSSEVGNVDTESKSLIHLRLSISAFELALVPFEFAIAPQGFPGSGSPLFLQTSVPVTLTREVRRGRPLQVSWNRKPRILFAFAHPGSLPAVPAQEHLRALRRAVEPWVKWKPKSEERIQAVQALLTVLPNATLEKIRQACAETEFTYIHILAHGAPFDYAGNQRYGLALADESDASKPDIVDGERLALALTANDLTGNKQNPPTLVSLASCDSGNTGSVLTPGGSIAHELHAGGIPWVVASQFPLWMAASTLMAETLYSGILCGEDPRWVLYTVRQCLRTNSASTHNTHDWASIVAYASVPWNFDQQVEAFRDFQMRTKLGVKLAKVVEVNAEERASLYQSIRNDFTQWLKALPSTSSPQDHSERFGMAAASEKQIGNLFDEKKELQNARKAYTAARDYYWQAVETYPLNHWALTQYLSLRAVLAEAISHESLVQEYGEWWIIARRIALQELQSASGESKAWAHGTLAELEMLGVVYQEKKQTKRQQEEIRRKIVEHCSTIRGIAGNESFPVFSTCRQFQRYLDCWKREEWQKLAEAAVKALEGKDIWEGPTYPGPRAAQV